MLGYFGIHLALAVLTYAKVCCVGSDFGGFKISQASENLIYYKDYLNGGPFFYCT